MRIKKVLVDKRVADAPETRLILSKIKAPHEIVHDMDRVCEQWSNQSGDLFLEGKKNLLLTENRGAFIKDCPGTSHYTCCGYKILHIGSYCVMDCSYCILQAYFHPPALTYFVNNDLLFTELEELFLEKKRLRIGTGEFTDSLIWEGCSDISHRLLDVFSRQSHAVLELKTKTVAIERFKGENHNRKTIMAWSVNSEAVIRSEERHTAPLAARLDAARKCASWGYPIAFHFDPMIIYDGWEKDYKNVVKQIFDHVSAENIVWISIGAFRFIPSLKKIIQSRFLKSKIVYGEFITGLDGKMRYFKPLRMDMYRKMAGWIRDIAPDATIYFCMEDDEVWENSLGFVPEEKGGLSGILDDSAARHCDLD